MKHQSQYPAAGQQAGPTSRANEENLELDFNSDPAVIAQHIAAAQRLRAQTTAAMFKAAFSWLFPSRGKEAKPETASPGGNQALPV